MRVIIKVFGRNSGSISTEEKRVLFTPIYSGIVKGGYFISRFCFDNMNAGFLDSRRLYICNHLAITTQ